MKLLSIKVTELFGIFDHEIKFKPNGITILIGENGLGKTTILEILHDFFTLQFDKIQEKDFNEVIFDFDDDNQYTLKKLAGSLFIKKKTAIKNTWYMIDKMNNKEFEYFKQLLSKKQHGSDIKKNHPISELDIDSVFKSWLKSEMVFSDVKRKSIASNINQKIKSVNDEKFLNRSDFENLSPNKSFYIEHALPKDKSNYRKNSNLNFSDFFFDEIKEALDGHVYRELNKIPSWFFNMIDAVDPQLIETQRILTLHNTKYSRSTIEICSEDLKDKLQQKAIEASRITSKLDSSFPNRLMKALRKRSSDEITKINNSLEELDIIRRKYSEMGVLGKLDNEDLKSFKDEKNIEESKAISNMISLYIEDSQLKLKPYGALYKKLSMFINLVNSRLRHKKLKACSQNGFRIISTVIQDEDEKIIAPNKLSSGEQHEIILFYKLIFMHKDNSFVLIDEPELSLHISWQNEFINDLREIINIKSLNVLIATHSPDIIGPHWNLTNGLKGLEE